MGCVVCSRHTIHTRKGLEMTHIENDRDVLDVRDLIERYEALRSELDDLTDLLDELRGSGGDHQWEGDWFPVTLIRDSYFQDYAQEMAEDIGAISGDASWPKNHIDWESAAQELQIDYSSVEFDGTTYWYR